MRPAFQSRLPHTVLMPERFRGIAPSAPGWPGLSRMGYSARTIGGPTVPWESYLRRVACDRMVDWNFELHVSDEAAALVRRKGGTVALDFIPPIS